MASIAVTGTSLSALPSGPWRSRLPRNDRRDVLMFLGFLGVLVTAVVIVLVARNNWPERRWVALGATAAMVQALAVLFALIFAWLQIKTSREEARRQRTDELIDRLQAAVHEELLPAWTTVNSQWRLTVAMLGWVIPDHDLTDQSAVWMAETYDRYKDELRSAQRALYVAAARTGRVLQLLGESARLDLVKLEAASRGLPVVDLPFSVRDAVPANVVVAHDRLAMGDEAATGLRRWVDSYIAAHVESGRAPPE